MKISVLLPVYNGMRFLAESLKSIQEQDFCDFEIIAIDDGSTDGTHEFLLQESKGDERLRVFQNEKQQGLVYTLNRAINLARGEFLARMDADDISCSQRFSRQLVQIEKGYDLVGCDYQIQVGETYHLVEVPRQAALFPFYLTMNVPFAHGSVMMRRAFLDKHGLGYRESPCEDLILWHECYLAGARFANVQGVHYVYREYGESFSGTKVEAMRISKYRDGLAFIEQILGDILNLAQKIEMKNLSKNDYNIIASLCLYAGLRTVSFTLLKKAFFIGSVGSLLRAFRYVMLLTYYSRFPSDKSLVSDRGDSQSHN